MSHPVFTISKPTVTTRNLIQSPSNSSKPPLCVPKDSNLVKLSINNSNGNPFIVTNDDNFRNKVTTSFPECIQFEQSYTMANDQNKNVVTSSTFHQNMLASNTSVSSMLEARKRNASKLKGLIIPEKPQGSGATVGVNKVLPTIVSAVCTSTQLPLLKGEEVSRMKDHEKTCTGNSAFTCETRLPDPPWITSKNTLPKYSPAFKRRQLEISKSASVAEFCSPITPSPRITTSKSDNQVSLSHSKPVQLLLPETTLPCQYRSDQPDSIENSFARIKVDNFKAHPSVETTGFVLEPVICQSIIVSNESAEGQVTNQFENAHGNSFEMKNGILRKPETKALHREQRCNYFELITSKENKTSILIENQTEKISAFGAKKLNENVQRESEYDKFDAASTNDLRNEESVKNFKALTEKWEQRVHNEAQTKRNKAELTPPVPPKPRILIQTKKVPPSLIPRKSKSIQNQLSDTIGSLAIDVNPASLKPASNVKEAETPKCETRRNLNCSIPSQQNKTIISNGPDKARHGILTNRTVSDICKVFENSEINNFSANSKVTSTECLEKGSKDCSPTLFKNNNTTLSNDDGIFVNDMNFENKDITSIAEEEESFSGSKGSCSETEQSEARESSLNSHFRMSSLDSSCSDSGMSTPGVTHNSSRHLIGDLTLNSRASSISNLKDSKYDSVTSLASSTSLISPQELQQLIDEANQSLDGDTDLNHNIQVVVLHREYKMSGSIGITLAGGADYESKEITVQNYFITGTLLIWFF